MGVKAKDFWDFLCNKMGYRNYFGFPCLELKLLYDNMNSNVMHYIPAVNSNVALGMLCGASLCGNKCGLILPVQDILIEKEKIVKLAELCGGFIILSGVSTSITSKFHIKNTVFDGNLLKLEDDINKMSGKNLPFLIGINGEGTFK